MLTLRSLLSLLALLPTEVLTHAFSAPDLFDGGGYIDIENHNGFHNYAAVLTGGDSCTDQQLKTILDGFDEMNKLFAAAQNPDFERECEIEFFGRPYRTKNLTSLIAANIQRAGQYSNLKGSETRNPDIHVRCDDPADQCFIGNKFNGKHTVYNIGNEPHINFCDRYFDMDSLDKVMENAADDPTKLSLMNYYNRATVWARMIMHFADVGSAVVIQPIRNPNPNSTNEWLTIRSEGPMNTSVLAGVMDTHPDAAGFQQFRIPKFAYGVTRAKLLATLSTQMDHDAANNPENYALYAQARYVMETKGFFPNIPIMNFGNDFAVLSNDQIQDGDRKKYACFDMPDVVPRVEGTSEEGNEIPMMSAAITTQLSQEHVIALVLAILLCLVLPAII